MADLTHLERRCLESVFDMSGGYVLDFSNRTFSDFVGESLGIDPDDPKYCKNGGSKANRLRSIWEIEPNHNVGVLIASLLNYMQEIGRAVDPKKVSLARKSSDRLLSGSDVTDLSAVAEIVNDHDFEVLFKEIKASIDKNQPEAGLDRLHTFVVKYLRGLCRKHAIETDRDKPLHSLMGEYIKSLKRRNLLESLMSERILKSSISTLEAYNDVRNERSLAHDNAKLLNHSESLLILNHVVSVIRFVSVVEQGDKPVTSILDSTAGNQFDDNIPF